MNIISLRKFISISPLLIVSLFLFPKISLADTQIINMDYPIDTIFPQENILNKVATAESYVSTNGGYYLIYGTGSWYYTDYYNSIEGIEL